MKKTAVCLLSSFLILTAAMAAGQESCPSIIYVSGMQAVYAADNEAGNPASKEKDMEADSSDAAETASDNSTAEDAADKRSTSENSTDGSQKGNAPQTGDTNNLLLWGTLAGLSALGLTLIALMYLFSLRDWRK